MKLALTSLFLCSIALSQTAAGHWQGKIKMPERELPISVDLAPGAKGAWIGSMTVEASTSSDVPLTDVKVDDAGVSFAAYLPQRATFKGSVSGEGGNTLAGTAANSQGEAPFELTRSGAAAVKVPAPSSPSSKEFEGSWEATAETNGRTSRVGLKLSHSADGIATGILIAHNMNELEIPISTVIIHGKELNLEIRSLAGSFKGTLGAGGVIAGEIVTGPNRVLLTFKRAQP